MALLWFTFFYTCSINIVFMTDPISWSYKPVSQIMCIESILTKNNNLIYKFLWSCIREYGGTLYEGLAHAVSPTNTNFRLTFLLTRLKEAHYEDLAV